MPAAVLPSIYIAKIGKVNEFLMQDVESKYQFDDEVSMLMNIFDDMTDQG